MRLAAAVMTSGVQAHHSAQPDKWGSLPPAGPCLPAWNPILDISHTAPVTFQFKSGPPSVHGGQTCQPAFFFLLGWVLRRPGASSALVKSDLPFDPRFFYNVSSDGGLDMADQASLHLIREPMPTTGTTGFAGGGCRWCGFRGTPRSVRGGRRIPAVHRPCLSACCLPRGRHHRQKSPGSVRMLPPLGPGDVVLEICVGHIKGRLVSLFFLHMPGPCPAGNQVHSFTLFLARHRPTTHTPIHFVS